jgi:hypothetical protein
MDEGGLSTALERAESALARIERALAQRQPASGRDDALRAKVRDAISELDQLIRQAGR